MLCSSIQYNRMSKISTVLVSSRRAYAVRFSGRAYLVVLLAPGVEVDVIRACSFVIIHHLSETVVVIVSAVEVGAGKEHLFEVIMLRICYLSIDLFLDLFRRCHFDQNY